MRVICCKCDKWLQDVAGPATTTSHGLCERCADQMLQELGGSQSVIERRQIQRVAPLSGLMSSLDQLALIT